MALLQHTGTSTEAKVLWKDKVLWSLYRRSRRVKTSARVALFLEPDPDSQKQKWE